MATRKRKPNPAKRRVKGTRIQNSRLDPDHHPFKRSANLGPGPRKTKRSLRDRWECKWIAPYKQECKWVGDPSDKSMTKRETKTIKVKPDWKREYNKEYWAHLQKEKQERGVHKFRNAQRPGYKARGPTPEWERARAKAAPKKRLARRAPGPRRKR